MMVFSKEEFMELFEFKKIKLVRVLSKETTPGHSSGYEPNVNKNGGIQHRAHCVDIVTMKIEVYLETGCEIFPKQRKVK